MKNETMMNIIDVEKVDSLESYAFHLALMCVSMQTLSALQEKAESIGIFDDDETQVSKTISHQISRVIVSANDLLRMCVERSGQDWEEFKKKSLKTFKSQAIRKPGKKK